jgi:hypothetical protein
MERAPDSGYSTGSITVAHETPPIEQVMGCSSGTNVVAPTVSGATTTFNNTMSGAGATINNGVNSISQGPSQAINNAVQNMNGTGAWSP